MSSRNRPEELPEGVEFADHAPKLSEALALPEGVEFAESPAQDKLPAQERGALATLGDMGMTGLANAFNTASMGLAPDLVDDTTGRKLTGTLDSPNAPPPGALKAQLVDQLTEGTKRNPYSAAIGSLGGFVAGAGAAGIPKALGLAKAVGGGFVKQRLARGAVGGLFGGLTSGAQTLASTHDLGKAWDATKSGAGIGAAAMAAPEITGPAMVAKGISSDDPVESASDIVNGLGIGIPGIAAHADVIGKPLEAAGQSAKVGILQSILKELVPQEEALVRAENKTAEAKVKDIFREHRRAKSSLSDAPSGVQRPSIPGQPDLEAQAIGKLGSKVQENFRYLRSKGDLGIKLNPEAEAGVQAILPDYEAQANTNLGEFAGGKEAVLKRILESLRNPEPEPTAAPGKPPLPRNMGFDVGFAGLKPNPTAGFTPKPLPTAESLAPRAAEGVNTRLQQMRQDQGIASRLGGAVVKGVMGPLGGSTFFKGARALVKDPVLATGVTEPIGKTLSKVGVVGDRYSKFLAGATGPLLQKKLEFLMRTDPEFKAQVEAANE